MRAQDVIDVMDDWAPPALAYSWDKAGLATGHPDAKVKTVLVALSITRNALDAALKARADMIVSHHPLIWEPLKSLRTDNAISQLCLDVAASGIVCYSAHTNLDVVPGGVNDVLAQALDLMDTSPLMPVPQARQVKLVTFVPEEHLDTVRDAVCDAGAGLIGDYTHCSFSTGGIGTFFPGDDTAPYTGKKGTINEESERRFEILVPHAKLPGVLEALFEAHPYEEVAYDVFTLENTDPAIGIGVRGTLESPATLDEFAEEVRHALDISHVRVVGDPDQPIRNVAVLGGAGGDLAKDVPDDIDVYVTGDLKYHEAQDAEERGLAIIDAGHHGTEKWIVPAVANYLKSHLGDLRVATFIEPDPFRVVTD